MVLSLAACGGGAPAPVATGPIDAVDTTAPAGGNAPQPGPEFSGRLVGGGSIDSSEFVDGPYALWFWSPW